MRKFDHDVLDPGSFLIAVLSECPSGSHLELEVLSPPALARALAPFAHRPNCYIVDSTTRTTIAALLAIHGSSLRATWLALRAPDDSRTWFEAPHFGEFGKNTVLLHDAFPEALAMRLRDNSVMLFDDAEIPVP